MAGHGGGAATGVEALQRHGRSRGAAADLLKALHCGCSTAAEGADEGNGARGAGSRAVARAAG